MLIDVVTGKQLNSSGKRRVTVSEFNKNTLVSIREYYFTDGSETKPGKKVRFVCSLVYYGCEVGG